MLICLELSRRLLPWLKSGDVNLQIRARRATEEEKEARLKGRIPLIALRDIMEQQQQASAAGNELDIPAIAQK